ncbi:co-chaperone p23, putative [Plasmodium berghei]|uniref:HSP20-like chaperone, putative n=2 Tax=Plasmodium berghei TaxID=5821 RepID=A0A509AHT0_PLABA|nr:HSP20-like chaperone, putative [Plasmodium berghei ANKA]CXI02848.1 co-chaperone p23, putative [Plasmodium berghei]SCL92018.1 co-chaperone p23, putative [Plasmodium berghei]SCM17369.1 co-chaperone p23, putative [Plasmodium berghei]SCN22614.1 co-chaperone p23, putative [Plasmodium berghei]VUC54342.1 HSP20-like chaperone, putative [Plasmodium berghei ANKA]|eukprot:XP_034420175.1 HSP20-like chaperone, putative [Plasmodium berghei ANKA]
MFFFCIFAIYVLLFKNVLSKLNFQNEQLAIAFFESHKGYIVTKEEIIDGIEKSWFELTNYLINESIKQGNDFSNDIKIVVNEMKQKLDKLLTASYSIKKIDTINASFQWAQSPEYIFLNIKFSHRWSSPGALKVKDEQIISEKNKFFFSAYSNDPNTVKKKYVVDIDLLHDIINSETKYNFASVGKVVITLKKKEKKIWNRLLLSKEKNPNLQVWWDMKEKYNDSVLEFLKEEEQKRKNEKTEKGNEDENSEDELLYEQAEIDDNENNNDKHTEIEKGMIDEDL